MNFPVILTAVKVLEIIQRSTEFLSGAGVESPRLHSELLLAHVLRLPRMRLYLEFEREVAGVQLDEIRALVKRRSLREPLQQIVGSTSFTGLEIRVTRDVLVPRPETELLAEEAWKRLGRGLEVAGGGSLSALDFGTGSGCLAIALAVHCPSARLVAMDCSTAALVLARANAEAHGVSDRITFLEGGTPAAARPLSPYALIVTNPPYIPSAEIETLAPEVREFEPRQALDGGPDGLEYYRVLAAEGAALLDAEGQLLAEFGDGQAPAIREIFRAQNWVVEAILEDYTRRPRILVARPGGQPSVTGQ